MNLYAVGSSSLFPTARLTVPDVIKYLQCNVELQVDLANTELEFNLSSPVVPSVS